ncbi:MAG: hypothetical protein R2875_15940 [Desulfobacterales bacterium]
MLAVLMPFHLLAAYGLVITVRRPLVNYPGPPEKLSDPRSARRQGVLFFSFLFDFSRVSLCGENLYAAHGEG